MKKRIRNHEFRGIYRKHIKREKKWRRKGLNAFLARLQFLSKRLLISVLVSCERTSTTGSILINRGELHRNLIPTDHRC